VQSAYQTQDEVGRPAIGFTMNPRGASMLGDLTGAHVGKPMAILLDDRVYTAPNLNSRISKSGIIQGSFDDAELHYIIRVLAAGSLQAKLSPEPISESQLGPQLGLDNLERGLYTGVVAFVVVSIFMVVYYFQCGLIAVAALWVNLLFILGIMALNRAAFTLPGIAGVILTFGQAVDSNVLVYERMREEFRRGADMRTAVRLGFSKAVASIVDGNVAHLIVCVVLLYVGTQEIKGFAITLAIGILGTLFGALVFSRLVFAVLVDYIGWRRTSMLPMVWPGLQHFLTPHINWIRLRWVWVVVSTVLVIAGLVAAYVRGPQMLDTEFRGGTQVDIVFRADPATKERMVQTRRDVEERVRAIGATAPAGSALQVFNDAEILPVNPRSDGVTSDHFQIKTRVGEDKQILAALVSAFSDLVESQPALRFVGSGLEDARRAPVYKILSDSLGENIDRPDIRDNVNAYVGGLAIVLDDITPAVSRQSLEDRMNRIRQRSEYSDTLGRKRELIVLGGDDRAVTSAVLVVRDESVSAFDNEERWWQEVGAREWRIVTDALGRTTELASVQTFSPAIAQTFVAQAVVAIFLSMVMLTIYVWVRFGAPRWALAATLPVFHDILGIIGLIALAQFLYENPVTGPFARSIGILPFKINLNLIAALLTIAGYSLNDTIIILDRIRENKGKLKYASAHAINDSINQTLSRTLITSGTTLISTVILYLFGGEAVRGFSYAFTLGVIVGTYSSIAISAPLVWSGKEEDDTPARPGAAGKRVTAIPPPVPA
jgi:SecD/SecF fusion protein